ncbi:MAG: hypothetical protein MUC51_00175 [Anaerolineae bacterium]|jgi:hypothetical protein|nr:hypothetical protein [Anaerolineae bacterium]
MSDQTQATLSAPPQPADEITISAADRAVLRRLASQVAELAAQPIEAEKRELWYRHNALEATRPVIFCDPENGWDEIIPAADLVCVGELARGWEMRLRKERFWGAQMCDDRVIEPYFTVRHVYTESDWGMHETRIGGGHGDAYRWESPLKSYADLDQLRFPQIVVDEEATTRRLALANDTLGDILPVRLKTSWWWTLGMTWTLVNLRGLAQIMYDMVDQPAALHRTMAFLRDGHLAKLDFLERNGLLSLNNDGTYVGSGGFGWTRELPQPDFATAGHVRPIDMWGFGESQETVGVSPAMFAEFIFPYQLPILERFGLNCYGCCEPLDKRWHIVQRIPRLRRVSVSAWANLPRMAEMLGDRYLFSWKPAPADLALDSFDEDAIRARLREGFRIMRGCRVEAIMKDNNTIRNDPSRVIRWVRIAREEAERM